MLPANGPLTTEQIDHVRSQLSTYLGEQNAKMPDVARSIGCSPKSLLQFMDPRHDGPLDDFARRINRWIMSQEQTGDVGFPTEMVETGVTNRMLGVIDSAMQLRSMAAIVGPSGIGKSTVFKAVASGMVPGAVHIELSSVDASKSAVIRRIAKELGGPARWRMQASFEWCVDHLSATSTLIMLDEVHYLSEAALNVVRDLHKRTSCPVVLGGTRDLLTTINDFNEYQGQFKRLVSLVYNITESLTPSKDSDEPPPMLYTVEEVRDFAMNMGIKLTIGAQEEASKYANLLGWGGFGSLGFLLINAHTLATLESRGRQTNPHVHEKHINSALRQMEGASGFDRVKHRTAQSERRVKTA